MVENWIKCTGGISGRVSIKRKLQKHFMMIGYKFVLFDAMNDVLVEDEPGRDKFNTGVFGR